MFLQPFYLSLDLLDEFPLRRFALYKVQKPLNVKISVVVMPAGTQKYHRGIVAHLRRSLFFADAAKGVFSYILAN